MSIYLLCAIPYLLLMMRSDKSLDFRNQGKVFTITQMKYVYSTRAQCYPRHACPLYASLFMHAHVQPLSAPALVLQTLSDPLWIMRIHASICTLMQKQKAT